MVIRGISFMVNDKSLISLALIKTNWEEQQKDFVDMMIPFVLYSLSDLKTNDIVSISDIRNELEAEFGIDFYNNVVETFFKRLASNKHYNKPYIRKVKSVYYRTDQPINVKSFESNREKYTKNQNDVINCFIDFLKSRDIIFDSDVAKNELISYLCKYGANILKSDLQIKDNTIWTRRIGEFIEYLYASDKSIFKYLEDIAKGGMISVVYFNNDKVKITKKFKNTEIYFDTPLLMHILKYSGEALQKTVQELVDLLYANGATVCTFEHNLNELEGILNAYVSRYKNGTLNTSYNFDYLIENDIKAEKIETDIPTLRYALKSKKIYVKDTPSYDDYWRNIGITNFNNYLSEKINYKKDDRRDNDVASISAIYRLRDRDIYHRYETCKALFVATNSFLVYHTQKYFKEEEYKSGIPAIVDDTFLTSFLWLKSIKKDDNLPTLKLIVDALAAQEPSKKFWDNFLNKVEELRERNEITDDELIELKYGLFSKKNMFDVTEGDSNKITHETVKKVQQINFRMQYRDVIEERDNVILQNQDLFKKYNQTHTELISNKSKKYLTKINIINKLSIVLGYLFISIIIYFLIYAVTNISGTISNSIPLIDLGLTGFILILCGIINQLIDKAITNQLYKITSFISKRYIERIYNTIKTKEGEYASDIIEYLKNNSRKS